MCGMLLSPVREGFCFGSEVGGDRLQYLVCLKFFLFIQR